MALFATAFAVDDAGKAQTRLGSGLQHGILHQGLPIRHFTVLATAMSLAAFKRERKRA
jgi:hypothetical protein